MFSNNKNTESVVFFIRKEFVFCVSSFKIFNVSRHYKHETQQKHPCRAGSCPSIRNGSIWNALLRTRILDLDGTTKGSQVPNPAGSPESLVRGTNGIVAVQTSCRAAKNVALRPSHARRPGVRSGGDGLSHCPNGQELSAPCPIGQRRFDRCPDRRGRCPDGHGRMLSGCPIGQVSAA